MQKLIADHWRLLLFGFALTFFSAPGQTFIISLFGAEIRSALQLSHGQFGGLYSLATLLSAAAILWSGRLVDSHNLKYLTAVVICLLAAALFGLSVATGSTALVISLFLLRHSGQGVLTHISNTAMIRYFQHYRGKTVAMAQAGFVAAEAVMPIVVISFIASAGWRTTLQWGGLFLLLAVIPVILYLLHDHHHTHARYLRQFTPAADSSQVQTSQRQWSRKEMLRDKRFYLALPAIMASSLIITGFFFHQVQLVQSKGWSLPWWGQMFMLYAAIGFLSTLLFGVLVDRYGAAKLLPPCLLPLAVGLLCLWGSSSPYAGAAYLMLCGITAGATMVTIGPLWAQMYGVQHLGAIKSVGSAVMIFASALSPVTMGVLIDSGWPMSTLALGGALYLLLASIAALIALRNTI